MALTNKSRFCFNSARMAAISLVSAPVMGGLIVALTLLDSHPTAVSSLMFCRGAWFIMDPAVQMDPPYLTFKEAVNQTQNNMVSSHIHIQY